MLSGNKYVLEAFWKKEVILAALFISVSNRYEEKTIHLLFATG